MALIFKYAIQLKEIAKERYGLTMEETDNCAGQFFAFDKPIPQEFKDFITMFLDDRKMAPMFWDEKSFSVKSLYGSKHDIPL